VVVSERRRSRCLQRLERLGASSLDRESIQLEAISELRGVIGFDRWCWPLGDPETLVPLGGLAEHDYGPQLARALELEYSGRDVAAMDLVAQRANPVGSLSAETRRDLARSPRWDEVLRPVGIGDEAVVACRDALGCWGWIKAYRDGDEASFTERDLDLLVQVGPTLGSALRRRIGAAPTHGVGALSSPGVVVLDAELRALSWTTGARAWIDALPQATLFARWGMLPAVLYPVAALARSNGALRGAHALERAIDGRWVKIEAALLEGYDAGRIAVALRGAAPAETFDMLSRAYALTRRERELVAALVAGLDTRAVTERLFISRHTVQDHLKSVFRKVGVRSRRELLARFADSPADQ
jgi:DNA-binding CsgD family transcriptional regulator